VSHAGVSTYLYKTFDEEIEKCFRGDPWDSDSCLWNRGELAQVDNYIQIVGHTPTKNGPSKVSNNYYLDTGCVYEGGGLGYLSALCFDTAAEDLTPQTFVQKNIE